VTFLESVARAGEAIAEDYRKSWLVGAWFVLPFAALGFTAQVWWGLSFPQALPAAAALGFSILCGRLLYEMRPKGDERHTASSHTNPAAVQEMPPGAFWFATRSVGDVVVVDVAGRITLGEGAERFRSEIGARSRQGQTKILVNLARVSYIDSSGIGAMVSSFTEVTHQGGQVKIVGLKKRVGDLLQIIQLCEVYDDESRAIQSFAGAQGREL
jgi:anti-sigma B factor antagonist